jgi:uncharacterized protein (TIGR03067 family)
LVLATGLLLAAEAPKDDAAKKDLEKFQGHWVPEQVVRDGQEVPADELKGLRLTVEGNTRTLRKGDTVVARTTFKLDSSKSPKEIDVTLQQGPMKGATARGIYEVSADTQKICLDLSGGDRPKEFASKSGSNHLLQVFRREKK